MDLSFWSDFAEKRGVKTLFYEYLRYSEDINCEIVFSKIKSVFLETKCKKKPIISLHPKKSNCISGLYIGYSVTNLANSYNLKIDNTFLPKNFEFKLIKQGNNEWCFGYFKQKEEVAKFMSYFLKI